MKFRALLIALGLFAPGFSFFAAAAETTATEERLARLEAQLARIEARLSATGSADALAPTLKEFADLEHQFGYDGKTPLSVVKVAGAETKLALGGFVQTNFESGPSPDTRFAGLSDRFLVRRARLFVAGAFVEDLSFKIESDFGANSLAAKTGQSGQLTDAYVSWTKLPAVSLRLGQFKTPFGYEQLMADTKIYSIERSLANDKLTLGRQIGAMVYGEVAAKRVSYSLGAYNGTSTNVNTNDNQKYLWVARTAAVVADTKVGDTKLKLTTGANYFTTVDKGTFTGRRYGTGLDAQLVLGASEFQTELLRNDSHPTVGKATAANGWSVLGAYNFTKQWQGIARYETYDSNTATDNTTTNEWTLGVNYLLRGDDLKLSLDYLSGSQPVPTPHGDRVIGRFQLMF